MRNTTIIFVVVSLFVSYGKALPSSHYDCGRSGLILRQIRFYLRSACHMDRSLKYVISFIFIILFQYPLFGQSLEWSRIYGGSNYDNCGNDGLCYTEDGGYAIVGRTNSFGAGAYNDIYLIRTNSFGDTLWTKMYGGPGYDRGECIKQTDDGGFIIFGTSSSFGTDIYRDHDVYVIRTDSSGDTLWTGIYGTIEPDIGRSGLQVADGGFLIAGTTEAFSVGDTVLTYLIKVNSFGDTLWTKTYGNRRTNNLSSVRQTTDGGFILIGWNELYMGAPYNAMLIKTNSEGDTIWTRTLENNSYHERPFSIEQTIDGGYIIAGETREYFGPANFGPADILFIKIDELGNVLWSKAFGGDLPKCAYSCIQDQDSGFILSGWIMLSDNPENADAYIIKTDSGGDTVWTRHFDVGPVDRQYTAKTAKITSDFNIIVAGDSYSPSDIILFKINPAISNPIPTLSEWGILIMALLLLAAGTVAVIRMRMTTFGKASN